MFEPHPHFRPARSYLPLIIFMAGFVFLMWFVADQFLVPGLEAAKDATPRQKRQLMAYSRLLMAIVLLVVCVSMLLLFRVRRFFFPPFPSKRQKTEYVDAWAEAGKRIQNTDHDRSDSSPDSEN